MRNFLLLAVIVSLVYLLNLDTTFAAVWDNELEKSKENLWIMASIFSTDMILNLLFAIFTIVATFAVSKIISWKLSGYLENMWGNDWANREELVWVISRTVNIIVLVVWFSISLTILWVDMWIFLGWLWFWIWFTLKIFLSNFISWIIMVTQWTYHNWDLIEIEGKMWTIKRIHALFTAVEQFDGVIYYVPNVRFLEENVSNYHTNNKRRVDIEVGVDYDTDIVKAKKVMLQVAEKFPNILAAPHTTVLVNKFSDSSISLILRFWIDSKDEYFQTKSNVTETVNLAFKQAWITIPFPQVTLSNRNNFNVKMAK